MKSHRFKYYYIRYFLRPTKTFKLSLSYLYGRLILFLAMKGIKVPGLNKVKQKLPKTALDIFERKILIYEIKGERFSFRKGPLWLRKLFELLLGVIDRNKFWLLIVTKTTFAIIIILLPIALFFVLRGMLPVPDRVAYKEITQPLNVVANYKTYWPYTEAPFLTKNLRDKESDNEIDPKNSRGVVVTPVLEPDAPHGLFHFGIGYYPSKLNLIRGFLAGESSPLNIQKHIFIPKENTKENLLRIQYYLFPSPDSNKHNCKIELTDENNHILFKTEVVTPDKDSLDEPTGLAKSWYELFTPDSLPGKSKVSEFILPLDTPPEKLKATVSLNEKTEETEHAPSAMANTNAKHDISQDKCVFALGDFSFEKATKTPPKKRGIIFILVDTLRADTAYNSDLMPNLNKFAKDKGTLFIEHRSQANMTVPSVTALFTSKYPREVGPVAFTYAADSSMRQHFYATKTPLLPTSMQNLGYRVGGIGWLSLFSEAMEGGVDFGFHNAIVSESPAYEARQITEQMGTWLENYGNTPFFLYVHYNTMHGPYKPPLSFINLPKFLAKPFGLNQRKQLYDGLARYWDDEFLNIIQKLKDLGIYDDVDIYITADHGAQFYEQPWYNLMGVEHGVRGGYADKGHSLLDEEVRVPLIVHLAKTPQEYGKVVTTPTAHIDLFPTIYNLAGGQQPSHTWKGIDFSKALINDNITMESLLEKRHSIYFDAHRYAGILYWGENFKQSPKKYIRQLDPDDVKLYLTHNPWSLPIHWYQPETFTSVDFKNHRENWLPTVPGKELKEIRQAYYSITPSSKILRIIPKYSGKFSAQVILKTTPQKFADKIIPKIDLIPNGMKSEEKVKSYFTTFTFSGNAKTDEAIWVNMEDSSLEKITFEKSITPIICQNGNTTQAKNIPKIFQNNVCPFFSAPQGILDGNYTPSEEPVVIQKSLSNEQVEQIEGKGAGEALQKALREWGYAK